MTRGFRKIAALICCGAAAGIVGVGSQLPVDAAGPANSSGLLDTLGTASFDSLNGVAVSQDGSVYVTGVTDDTLSTFADETSRGGRDVFVSRLSPSGTPIWTRQLGTSGDDNVNGIAVSRFGEVYVVGTVRGSLKGPGAGAGDAFIASIGSSGSVRWLQQFGTPAEDTATSVAVSRRGDVYVAGWTDGSLAGASNGGRDAFVRRVQRTGAINWTKQFGTAADDDAAGITASVPLAVYVTGRTQGAFGLPGEGHLGTVDGYVMQLDTYGARRWTHQFGSTGDDRPSAIARSTSGRLVVAGDTTGSLDGANHGETDLFLASFTRTGSMQWIRQYGTPAIDRPTGLVLDRAGDAYAGGTTFGSMNRPNLGGGGDAIVARFNQFGERLWTEQFGTDEMDEVQSLAATSSGDVYAVGYSYGPINGASAGGVDGFILRFGRGENQTWVRQSGTIADDRFNGVVTSTKGEVVAVGTTAGSIVDLTSGGDDAVVARYAATGRRLWVRQFGTTADDSAAATATTRGGDVIVVGRTDGTLAAGAPGGGDVFVARYSSKGRLKWMKQFGSPAADAATAVAVTPNGSIVVTGTTTGSMSTNAGETNPSAGEDVFVTLLAPDGARRWTRQFGSEDVDFAAAVAVAADGTVLVGGSTFGTVSTYPGETSRDAFDGFVAGFDKDGTPLWRRQFGSESNDLVSGISANPTGGFDVSGSTGGTINEPAQGGTDAFVAHFSGSGQLAWLHQFGTVYNDSAAGVTVLANGDIMVSGNTDGVLGDELTGGRDLFVARFTKLGNQTSLTQLGTTGDDEVLAAASGPSGSLLLVGRTTGSMNEDALGLWDAFVTRLA